MDVVQPGAWYAAVDYIRMSWEWRNDYENLLHDVARKTAHAGRSSRGGYVPTEDAKLLGYRGWKTGSAFMGVGEQGVLLQASGLAAQYVAECKLQPDNVSRIDVQCTFWFPLSVPWLAVAAETVAVDKRRRDRGRKVAVKRINGNGDGDTLYIGTRGKRTKFLRLYDKHAESGSEEYRNAWRYEAELTDAHAANMYGSLMDIGTGPDAIAAAVAGYYDERGIRLPATGQTSLIQPEKLPTEPTTNERRLAWLRNQVAPSIAKLLTNGVTMEEVLKALGLADGNPT